MENFGQSLQESDFDWEFNAPHWYDFEKEEDTEKVDAWFDIFTDDSETHSEIKKDPITKSQPKLKHATRIPISKTKNDKRKEFNKSANLSQRAISSSQIRNTSKTDQNRQKIQIIESMQSGKFPSKLPVRIPLKEKKGNLNH